MHLLRARLSVFHSNPEKQYSLPLAPYWTESNLTPLAVSISCFLRPSIRSATACCTPSIFMFLMELRTEFVKEIRCWVATFHLPCSGFRC